MAAVAPRRAAGDDSEMKPARPDLLPDRELSREDMRTLQLAIRDKAIYSRATQLDEKPLTIAGIDQAFGDDTVTSAVVVWRDGDVLAEVTETVPLEFPYIPGYLAFREGGPIVAALRSVTVNPDVLLIDGNGRIHPRHAGLATHVGVVMDMPAVGVAKSLLCGILADSPDRPLSTGTQLPIYDEETGSTIIGYALQTKQWDSPDRWINPVYVSPGHYVDADTAVAVVEQSLDGYKIPEPIRLADRVAAESTGTR